MVAAEEKRIGERKEIAGAKKAEKKAKAEAV